MKKLVYKDLCVVGWMLVFTIAGISSVAQGALSGERFRILISSDIGGNDEDDDQSFVHYLAYADLFDIEGLISSPPFAGRAKDFLKIIDVYQKDFPRLKEKSKRYPSPDFLRSIVRQGATEAAPPAGFSRPTPGSEWIVQSARKDDQRPLYVLVWGSITDVAQAVHDAPDIKSTIRVHFIASWNETVGDSMAYRYLFNKHPDLWIIHDNSTFRGFSNGGDQSGDLGNTTFVDEHVRPYGALGKYFYPLKSSAIKMGDSPTLTRLLRGNAADPSQPSWGGQFKKLSDRKNWWVDTDDPALAEGRYPGAKTVSRWRKDFLRDWQQRMLRFR